MTPEEKAQGKHYKDAGIKVDLLDVAPDIPFALGNMLKYLIRAGTKEGESYEDDMAKAKVYARIWCQATSPIANWSDTHPVQWYLIRKMLPSDFDRYVSDEYLSRHVAWDFD